MENPDNEKIQIMEKSDDKKKKKICQDNPGWCD